VIIVGAGPAGSTAAYRLVKLGARVLVLEKDAMPRYKTCAGGVNVRAAKLLDFDISPVAERIVSGICLSLKLEYKLTRRYEEPITYMVCRKDFDRFLADKACAAGAEFAFRRKVTGVKKQTGGLKVITEGGCYTACVVIGADGAGSLVAKSLRLGGYRDFGLGLEMEVYASEDKLDSWTDLMGIDLGMIPGGYGWLFPKKDHFSIGVVGQKRYALKLKPYLEKLLKSYGMADVKRSRVKGAVVPFRRRGDEIACQRGLLVGDAAGLVDASTGEGIYYALRSARIAAEEIHRFLKGDNPDLKNYQRRIDNEIMPEIDIARCLQQKFRQLAILSPRLFFRMTAGSKRIFRAICKVVRGERSYLNVNRELGNFGFLFKLAVR